jgi:guanylate kinase
MIGAHLMTQAPSHTGLMIVLVGPAGVGKSTIARRLSEKMDVKYIASATTRQKRPGDDNAKVYEYIDRDEFFRRLDQDAFLEYAQVYDEYYGTPKHPALDYLAAGQDVLLEIDVQGAMQVRYQYPNALLVFILPPDAPTLLQRLVDRRRDSPEEIQKRFRVAKREVQMAKGSRAFDHMVINDTVDRAVEEIIKTVKHKRSGGI